ncbi:DUF411 domain-containing protein [Sandaracinobacter neustonicus]|uniref:DUF411 domain-containing protein n=2 Tax=Sandaracinobacter neustonicus TaxID=1715348 RepID=A0A501XJN5_9SPHN|nr:DUF411 domain-containing protein [Sandaracinobacter neustonicus]
MTLILKPFGRRTFLAASLAVAAAPALASAQTPMTVYRDAGCGCCLKWAAMAGKAGFTVRVVDQADMQALKRRIGIPEPLWSCHTAMVEGRAVEGHVPFAAIRKMLAMGTKAPRGIAVPGMPVGSPGMEVPDGRREPFDVMAFDQKGTSWRFA